MGPILPFMSVYGKKIGVSSIVMGSITSLLPILYLLAKPIFGFIVDYFQEFRKSIFMILLSITSTSFILLYVLPSLPGPHFLGTQFENISIGEIDFCNSMVRLICFIVNYFEVSITETTFSIIIKQY